MVFVIAGSKMVGHTDFTLSWGIDNEKVGSVKRPQFFDILRQTPARLEFGAVKLIFHFGFWGIALLIGLASGAAAILFRLGI